MRVFHARRRGRDLNCSLARIGSGRLRASTVEVILERLLRRFHGLERFIEEWVRCARSSKQGSVAALRAFSAVAQLIAIAEERRPPEPAVESLTDAELERELVSLMTDYVEGRSLLDPRR